MYECHLLVRDDDRFDESIIIVHSFQRIEFAWVDTSTVVVDTSTDPSFEVNNCIALYYIPKLLLRITFSIESNMGHTHCTYFLRTSQDD